MRILLYNIRYATGTGPAFHLPVPGAGYLRSNRQVLSDITQFIKNEDPDIVGLVEVDTGSIRTGMVNQAEFIAAELGHYSIYECKYGIESINTLMPIVRKQANAFLASPRVHGERFHYFDTGIKRLIIELELEEAVRVPGAPVAQVPPPAVPAAHAARARSRLDQARARWPATSTPSGAITRSTCSCRLRACSSANTAGLPSYPSHNPRRELDFILVQRRHRGHELPRPRGTLLRPPAAGLRFRGARARRIRSRLTVGGTMAGDMKGAQHWILVARQGRYRLAGCSTAPGPRPIRCRGPCSSR